MNHTPLYFLSIVCSIATFFAVWEFGFRPFCLDALRNRLFELRYELFQFGMSGELEFESQTYRYFETTLNAVLRHAHKASLLSFAMMQKEDERAKREDPEYVDSAAVLVTLIRRNSPDTQIRLTHLLDEMQRTLLKYVVCSSLPALVVGASLLAIRSLSVPIDRTRVLIAETIARNALREDESEPIAEIRVMHPAHAA